MKTTLHYQHFIKGMAIIVCLLISNVQWAQDTIPDSVTCLMPWVPPMYSVEETHSDVPQSFWQNGGHIPENVVDEDNTNYARAHIKETGSATLNVSDADSNQIYPSGIFVGYLIKSEVFRDGNFAGVSITTYLNGVMMESYSGVHLLIEYIPQFVNDPINIGFITTREWNEIEVTFDTAGGRIHYDVFHATLGVCNTIPDSITCKMPWIPPMFSVDEMHSEVPQSFWQNGGHIPANVVDEDTTNYARAHIKATGSATLKVSDTDSANIYPAGEFVGFYVKSRAFRDGNFDGVTITTYLNGVMMESYSGVHLMIDSVPQYVNDPIHIGFITTREWNEIEITFDTEGGKVHYDVFYAVIGICNLEELPPGLPVSWLSFEVERKGEVANLTWITSQELNNEMFNIERAADGRHFVAVGNVSASIDPRSINQYTFTDRHPLRGLNYYRIQQVDRDGKAQYSEMRTISFNTEGVLTSWPNPAVESLFIQLPDETSGQIRMINSTGMVVLTKTYEVAERESNLDISNLDPGLYSLIIETPYNLYQKQIVVIK